MSEIDKSILSDVGDGNFSLKNRLTIFLKSQGYTNEKILTILSSVNEDDVSRISLRMFFEGYDKGKKDTTNNIFVLIMILATIIISSCILR